LRITPKVSPIQATGAASKRFKKLAYSTFTAKFLPEGLNISQHRMTSRPVYQRNERIGGANNYGRHEIVKSVQ